MLDFVTLCDVVRSPDRKCLRPDYLEPLAKAFYDAEQKGKVRVCCSCPPQMGKTTLLLHALVRYLLRNPHRKAVYITHTFTGAITKAREAQAIAQKAGLRLSVDTTTHWITPEGGGLRFMSVNGPIEGDRVDLFVVDDPHKEIAEIYSETIREGLWEWWNTTALGRLSDGGSIIVNMHRWHPDDLIGRLLERHPETWKEITFPAILDEGKPTERALWPEVKSLEHLKELRRQIGDPKLWAALYEGKPVADGQHVFGPATYYEKMPDLVSGRIALGCDVASSPGRGDHSSIFVMCAHGIGGDQVVDVLDYWTGQVSLDDLAQQVSKLSVKWNCPGHVEINGVGAGLPALIRRVRPGLDVYGINSSKSKYLRAQPAAAAWNGGRLRLPKGQSWSAGVAQRIGKFTGHEGERDDDADALAICFDRVDRPSVDRLTGVYRLPGLV